MLALTVVVHALSKIQAVRHGWPSRDAHAGQRVVDFQALQSVREEAVHLVPRISRATKVDACRAGEVVTFRRLSQSVYDTLQTFWCQLP